MIGYCGGTFDLIHPGHVHMFRWVKEQIGAVVVSVNTDEFVERYKGKRPVMPYDERSYMLSALRDVDYVIRNDGDEDSKVSLRHAAALFGQSITIVSGADWTAERLKVQMRLEDGFMREYGIQIKIFPHSLPIHTTDIKRRLA
jgi:glycerol-3-phosphate cytidylyltransferase